MATKTTSHVMALFKARSGRNTDFSWTVYRNLPHRSSTHHHLKVYSRRSIRGNFRPRPISHFAHLLSFEHKPPPSIHFIFKKYRNVTMRLMALTHHQNNLRLYKLYNVDLYNLSKQIKPQFTNNKAVQTAYHHILKQTNNKLLRTNLRQIHHLISTCTELAKFYWRHLKLFGCRRDLQHYANLIHLQLFHKMHHYDQLSMKKFVKKNGQILTQRNLQSLLRDLPTCNRSQFISSKQSFLASWAQLNSRPITSDSNQIQHQQPNVLSSRLKFREISGFRKPYKPPLVFSNPQHITFVHDNQPPLPVSASPLINDPDTNPDLFPSDLISVNEHKQSPPLLSPPDSCKTGSTYNLLCDLERSTPNIQRWRISSINNRNVHDLATPSLSHLAQFSYHTLPSAHAVHSPLSALHEEVCSTPHPHNIHQLVTPSVSRLQNLSHHTLPSKRSESHHQNRSEAVHDDLTASSDEVLHYEPGHVVAWQDDSWCCLCHSGPDDQWRSHDLSHKVIACSYCGLYGHLLCYRLGLIYKTRLWKHYKHWCLICASPNLPVEVIKFNGYRSSLHFINQSKKTNLFDRVQNEIRINNLHTVARVHGDDDASSLAETEDSTPSYLNLSSLQQLGKPHRKTSSLDESYHPSCVAPTLYFDRLAPAVVPPINPVVLSLSHRSSSRATKKRRRRSCLFKAKKALKRVLYAEAIKVAPRQITKNLSTTYSISPSLQKLLARGPKFVVTPRFIDFHQIHVATYNWARAIRLHWFFNRPLTEEEQKQKDAFPGDPQQKMLEKWLPKKIRTNWDQKITDLSRTLYPLDDSIFSGFEVSRFRKTGLKNVIHSCGNSKIEAFIQGFRTQYLEESQVNQRNKRFESNITKEEHDALREFLEDDTVIARPEDKGTNFCVLDRSDYERLALANIIKSNMVEVPHFNIQIYADQYNQKLLDWYSRGQLKLDWVQSLKARFPAAYHYKAANIFALQKTHKDDSFKQRVVVSSTSTVYKRANIFALDHIMPIWQKLPYQIKDSKALMYLIRDLNLNDQIAAAADAGELLVFSLDVEAMYPSIKHRYGRHMLEYAWTALGGKLPAKPSKECILDLITMALEGTISEFNGRFYRAIDGAGIGIDFAAQYCDIAMHAHIKCLNNPRWVACSSAIRIFSASMYRDDSLLLGRGSLSDVHRLLNQLNNFLTASHEAVTIYRSYKFVPRDAEEDINNIKFTLDIDEANPTRIKVLDVHIQYDDDSKQLTTKVFSKETDAHCYLHTASCHPHHTFQSNITQVALRIRSLTDDQYLDEVAYEYRCFLIARGYDPIAVNVTFNYYENLTKWQALSRYEPGQCRLTEQKAPYYERSHIYFVNTYHPLLPDFYTVLQRNWTQWIGSDPILSQIFPVSMFKPSFKRSGNLKEKFAANTYQNTKTNPSAITALMTYDERRHFTKPSAAPLYIEEPAATLTIDCHQINRSKLDEWKGFVRCSDLHAMGVINKHSNNCICVKHGEDAPICVNTKKWQSPITRESVRAAPRSTCFSRNVIYLIYCVLCNLSYIGKSGEGVTETRTLADRIKEHIYTINKVYNNLAERKYYDNDGAMIPNVHQQIVAARGAFECGTYTREVLHFTGLDSTDCHKKNGGKPCSLLRVFVVDQFDAITRGHMEALLCETEKRRQAQLCTVFNGMNGSTDFAKTSTFTTDFIDKVDQDLLDKDAEEYCRYLQNVEVLRNHRDQVRHRDARVQQPAAHDHSSQSLSLHALSNIAQVISTADQALYDEYVQAVATGSSPRSESSSLESHSDDDEKQMAL